MSQFKQIKSDDDIKAVIKSAFDADLDLSGAWGYTQELSTVLHSTDIPLSQAEHILASMRSYIEMNMTLPKEDRYGSINVREIERSQITENKLIYDKITYEITAMKEETYNAFINAYKEGYGTNDFDLKEHFDQRKKATVSREEVYWFEIHQTLN
jgi:hypothetical protein